MRAPGGVLFGSVAAGATIAAYLDNRRAQRWIKPWIGPVLAARVWRERRTLGRSDTALLLAATAASTVGDVYMIDVDEDRFLLRGAGAFTVMHAAYCALLHRRGARLAASSIPRFLPPLGTAVVMARRAPGIAAPLTGYGLALSATGALCARARSPRLMLGSTLFTGSDATVLARRLFLADSIARRRAEAAIIASYAVAQWLLITAMVAPHPKHDSVDA